MISSGGCGERVARTARERLVASSRQVTPRDIPEGHGGAERRAGGRISAFEDAGGIVADRIQAGDRRTVTVDHLRVGIGVDAGKGAEFARDHAHRIKRRLIERSDAWFGLCQGAPLKR